MENTILKPNMIVRIGTIVGVVESEDIYRRGTFNVYCGNKPSICTDAAGISDVISIDYVGSDLFAFQVYRLIK